MYFPTLWRKEKKKSFITREERSSHNQRRCLVQMCKEEKWIHKSHGWICMLICSRALAWGIPSDTVRLTSTYSWWPWCAPRTAKNSAVSPHSESSGDRTHGGHVKTHGWGAQRWMRRLKCVPLIKMYLWLVEPVIKVPIYSWACCVSVEEGVRGYCS